MKWRFMEQEYIENFLRCRTIYRKMRHNEFHFVKQE